MTPYHLFRLNGINLIKSTGLERKVTFLGRISASQMREEYLKCGMFVCPSSIENSPNSLVEAALMGAPVIASRVGGIPDVAANDNFVERLTY